MTFVREKRLLLGALAFLAVLPLPFNEPRPQGVVDLPFLFFYLLLLSIFLRQAHLGSSWRLPTWAMNVLGLVYLPVFLYELRSVGGSNLVRPMIRLLMLGLLAKLFSMKKDEQQWQVTVLIFFLFIGAMATSVHPLILVYLIGFVVLAMCLLFRFMHFHLLAVHPSVAPRTRPMPVRRLLLVCTLFTVAISVPLFTLMPRLHAPYVLGRGLPLNGGGLSTGFKDEVSLDAVGRVRSNNAVALRLKMERKQAAPPLRYRAAAYEVFENKSWSRALELRDRLRSETPTFFRLVPERPKEKMRIWLEPLGGSNLILPVEAVSVEVSGRLYADASGSVNFLTTPRTMREYRVGLGSEERLLSAAPASDPRSEPTLDRRGITPRIASLAESLVGNLAPAEKARRIERHLADSYEYSLDLVGSDANDPISHFLFTTRSGHCEYFATAMVLMLRAQGIPARFVAGFLGAELNPLEGYFIVRHSSAHAWVEAYLPGIGWKTFDPTPAAGRPGAARPDLSLMLRQAWDYLQFRWDRYVMAYGSLEQFGLLLRLRQFVSGLWQNFGPSETTPEAGPAPFQAPRFELSRIELQQPLLIAAILALLGVLAAAWRRRSRFSATRAYRDLRALLARRDPEVSETTAPLRIYDRVSSRFPEAAASAQSLIQLYLLESYAGQGLAKDETLRARQALRRLRSLLR